LLPQASDPTVFFADSTIATDPDGGMLAFRIKYYINRRFMRTFQRLET